MLHHVFAQLIPVVAVGVGFLLPQVELELALGEGTPFEGLVFAFGFGEFHRGLHGGVVDGFEDFVVDVESFGRFEGQAHLLERVG